MSTISINGRVITGGNIVVKNGKVFVDDADVTPEQREVSITVTGDIQSISADACEQISVTGNVTGSVKTMSGDVHCGDVGGSASTMSGDIWCKAIAGNASSMSGDITSK